MYVYIHVGLDGALSWRHPPFLLLLSPHDDPNIQLRNQREGAL